MGKMWDQAKADYKRNLAYSVLGNRVAKAIILENEAGQECAVFQIKLRCAEAHRRNRIYH
jgi:hypothetical protein